MNSSILLALPDVSVICMCHLKYSLMVTLRYLEIVTFLKHIHTEY